jgi:putative FmdB family regulatory protein
MPTYEYTCRDCSHQFETWQKMTDEPLTICPECGGHIRRVLFPAGIVFKGSGFYKTDHASSSGGDKNGHAKSNGHTESGKAGEEKTSSESKSGESSSGTSSESKVVTETK